MKLASFLTKDSAQGGVMFIFDEPTTGLHFHDINKLLTAFNALIERDTRSSSWNITWTSSNAPTGSWISVPKRVRAAEESYSKARPRALEQCPESYTGKFLSLRTKLYNPWNSSHTDYPTASGASTVR